METPKIKVAEKTLRHVGPWNANFFDIAYGDLLIGNISFHGSHWICIIRPNNGNPVVRQETSNDKHTVKDAYQLLSVCISQAGMAGIDHEGIQINSYLQKVWDNHHSKIKEISIDISNIDWRELERQKNLFVEAIDSSAPIREFGVTQCACQGILNLLDYFQDAAAEKLGTDTVYQNTNFELYDIVDVAEGWNTSLFGNRESFQGRINSDLQQDEDGSNYFNIIDQDNNTFDIDVKFLTLCDYTQPLEEYIFTTAIGVEARSEKEARELLQEKLDNQDNQSKAIDWNLDEISPT